MDNYLVRASALHGYRETVLELGGNPDELMASAGLVGTFGDPESWISYTAYLELLENSARETHCPTFGLRLSKKQDINILGAVGFVIQQAPDIRTALHELSHYFRNHNQGATMSLSVEGDFTHVYFTAKPRQNAPMHQQSDLVIGLSLKVMRFLYKPWKPIAIYLPHSAPQDTRPYRELFVCPVYFDWDRTVIVIDTAILDIPLDKANPDLHRVLEVHLKEMHQNFPDDYPAKISYLIKQALLTGECSIERVSSFLSINKRTLQRKLKTQGLSYMALQDEVRFEIARNYLRETDGSLTVLSQILCYSELSTFSNAFRHHHGVSPRQWKKQQAEI